MLMRSALNCLRGILWNLGANYAGDFVAQAQKNRDIVSRWRLQGMIC
jgi:hypothetical protein